MNNEVAKKNGDTVRTMIAKMRGEFEKALPSHITPDRFVRVALTAITKTPKLAECTQASLFECLLTCSQLGLEPDGRRAHLIPYGTKCTLVLDYKGIAELVMRAGGVSVLHADMVCENDTFRYNKGVIESHEINFRKPRGEAYAVYCLVKLKDGSEKSEVMSLDEVNYIRDKHSQSWNGRNRTESPWATSPGEMAKKTVFKRLAKWLPWSPEIRDAIERDDESDTRIIEVERSSITERLPIGLPPLPTEDDTEPETDTVSESDAARLIAQIRECETLEAIRLCRGNVEKAHKGKKISANELGTLQDALEDREEAIAGGANK